MFEQTKPALIDLRDDLSYFFLSLWGDLRHLFRSPHKPPISAGTSTTRLNTETLAEMLQDAPAMIRNEMHWKFLQNETIDKNMAAWWIRDRGLRYAENVARLTQKQTEKGWQSFERNLEQALVSAMIETDPYRRIILRREGLAILKQTWSYHADAYADWYEDLKEREQPKRQTA